MFKKLIYSNAENCLVGKHTRSSNVCLHEGAHTNRRTNVQTLRAVGGKFPEMK